MEILSLKDISFQYGKNDVLNKVSLAIEKGEQASLLGLSGSGKTTLLRLCAGFEKPGGGQIILRDQLVAESTSFIRCKDRKVGFVFQDYALFPHLSIQENIDYGCSTKTHRAKSKELIKLLKLKDHLNKYPEQLSGGEKQKVALARTLCLEPDLVLLDEPFSSIDQQQTKVLVKELRQLFQKLGVTSLMVTHSQYEAIDFSDKIFVLNEGKLLQSGSPEELYSKPQSEFVADFFGIASWIKGKAKAGTVETELGSLKLNRELKKVNCKVLLRPEELQLNKTGEGLSCEIISQAYRFDRWFIDAKTPGGEVITVSATKAWPTKSDCYIKYKAANSVVVF